MATNLRGRITRLEERIDLRPLCATCSGGDPIQFTLRLIRGEMIPRICPGCGCPPPRPSIYVLRQVVWAGAGAAAAAPCD